MDLVERRRLLNRKGSDTDMKEWIKIFDETITVTEPTQNITKPLLQSCEGMTEMYAILSITANEDETDKTGNDNSMLYIGKMGVNYGRLFDMSKDGEVILHSTYCNDNLTFFEIIIGYNNLLYNVNDVQGGYYNNSSYTDYDNFILSTFSRPYKGTIKARVFAR